MHDEVERDGGDVSDFVAGIREAAPVFAERPNDRLLRNVPAIGELVGGNHRFRRSFVATQCRFTRRIRWVASDPRISRFAE